MRGVLAASAGAMMLAMIGPAKAGFEDGRMAAYDGDYPRAVAALLPLAANGHVQSQIGIGLFYAKGLGLPQDWVQARYWFQQAVDNWQSIRDLPYARVILILAQTNLNYVDDVLDQLPTPFGPVGLTQPTVSARSDVNAPANIPHTGRVSRETPATRVSVSATPARSASSPNSTGPAIPQTDPKV